jgi:hypothetical protein
MSFSATALVGFQSVPVVVVVVVVVVDVDAALEPVFFDAPLPLAVVVEVEPLAFEPPAWSVFAEVDFGDFVGGAFVVVLVVFGLLEFELLGAASTLTVSPAAATNAAGIVSHLVIAPPCRNSRASVVPVPRRHRWL